MVRNNRFFIKTLCMIMTTCLVGTGDANAAVSRTSVRSAPATRKSVTTAIQKVEKTTATNIETPAVTKDTAEDTTAVAVTETETITPAPEPTPEIIIENKSSGFELAISEILDSSLPDNSFAEQIRKQRAALAATDAATISANAQKKALATNSNTCDSGLRKCMQQKCGNDFTKCALDGDTIFGDKLNACRRDTECTGEEFSLFVNEIRSDRDMNVRLASYNNVIDCGNQYNACIVNECGTTYNKCLGKANADAAIQKCATIAKECTESDSGLANRFGIAIGKLRETAEKEVKADEERLYAMRDSMSGICKKLGAMFDERFFDCVFTVNFFAGERQTEPIASRKRFAGDTFVCMQEWFGVNATTYKENAYRETRAQTAASSAMLGSGVGTAVGLVTSGAIGRSLDTQKAKKDLKSECSSQGGELKKGKCVKDGKEIKINEDTKKTDKNISPDKTAKVTGSDTAAQNQDTAAKTNRDTAPIVQAPAPSKEMQEAAERTYRGIADEVYDSTNNTETNNQTEALQNSILGRMSPNFQAKIVQVSIDTQEKQSANYIFTDSQLQEMGKESEKKTSKKEERKQKRAEKKANKNN